MEADMDSSTSPLRQMMRSYTFFLAGFGETDVPCRSYLQESGKDVICFARRRLVELVQLA